MTQINPCKSNDGLFVTRMNTRFCATLIYKWAAQLASVPVITQPFCEGQCGGWGQTAAAARWLIIADSSEWTPEWDPRKTCWLQSYSDHTPWSDQEPLLCIWKRQHSAWRLSPSIVLINCRWLNKAPVFFNNWRKLDNRKKKLLLRYLWFMTTFVCVHPCMRCV